MSELYVAVSKFDLVGWTNTFLPIQSDNRKNARFDCPFCNSKRTLNVGKEKKTARCFRCETGHEAWSGRAGVINWIMLLKRCSKYEAIKVVLDGTGILPSVEWVEKETDYSIPKEAMPITTACSVDHPCRVFLRGREMEHLIDKFSVCVTGRYAGRIIMPIYWHCQYLGFEAKTYCNQNPKSLSHCEPDSLYSTRYWDKSRKMAVITESVLDSETIGVNAVGLLTSSLGEDKFIRLLELRKVGVETLVWFLDGDALTKQMGLIARWTSIYFVNKAVRTPKGEDPNSLRAAKCWELINAAKLIESEYDTCV